MERELMGTTDYDILTLVAFGLILFWLISTINQFLKGKTYLLTAYNCLSLGCIVFIGLASLSLTQEWQEPWGVFTRNEVRYLITGILLFTLTTQITYAKLPLYRTAGRKFLSWPKTTNTSLVAVALVAVAMSLFFHFAPSIPVLGQILRIIGGKSTAFAVVLIFVAWFQDRSNIFFLALLAFVFLYSLAFGILAGGGRRTFITALAGIPIAFYWLEARKWPRLRTLISFSVLLGILSIVIVVYGGLRHRSRYTGQERNIGFALETLALLPQRFFEGDGKQLLGQRAIECSMLSLRTYSKNPQPFAAAKFVLTNPMPRSLWPEKPAGLGYSLPKDFGATTKATWGPGIVGHAAHEGSVFFVVLYGCVLAAFLRLVDEYLARQPQNPFLIATFVSVFPHIVGWVRGDIGTFTLQIIGGIVTLVLFYKITQVFSGGKKISYPPTSHIQLKDIIS